MDSFVSLEDLTEVDMKGFAHVCHSKWLHFSPRRNPEQRLLLRRTRRCCLFDSTICRTSCSEQPVPFSHHALNMHRGSATRGGGWVVGGDQTICVGGGGCHDGSQPCLNGSPPVHFGSIPQFGDMWMHGVSRLPLVSIFTFNSFSRAFYPK